jgi:hypothetical protein
MSDLEGNDGSEGTYGTGDARGGGIEGEDVDDEGLEGVKLIEVVSRFGVRNPGICGRGRRTRPISNFFKGAGGQLAENNKLKQPSRM